MEMDRYKILQRTDGTCGRRTGIKLFRGIIRCAECRFLRQIPYGRKSFCRDTCKKFSSLDDELMAMAERFECDSAPSVSEKGKFALKRIG